MPALAPLLPPFFSHRLSLCVWLTVVGTSLRYTPNICRSASLAHPAAQRLTHHIDTWLGGLAYLMPHPVSVVVRHERSPHLECVTVIRFLQFGLGLLAPQLVCATSEARLFQHHQQQRWQAGLSLEQGMQAAVYDALWWLMLGGSGAHVCLVCLPLLAACWDWCAFFTACAQ